MRAVNPTKTTQPTHVDPPELLHTVEGDDLFQQLVPVLLAAWWFGEPERPAVLQLMLDGKVLRVVKYAHDLVVLALGAVGSISHGAVGRDGDRVEWDRLGRHVALQDEGRSVTAEVA